ncbi:MAG: hypothetical protein ACKVQQ_16860 [Burkholderiales bacterium]
MTSTAADWIPACAFCEKGAHALQHLRATAMVSALTPHFIASAA